MLLIEKKIKSARKNFELFAKIIIFIRLLFKPISARWLCKKLDNISKKYDFNKCKYIGCIQWGYGPQERVHKAPWMKPVELEFEGVMFPCPSNYDEYLGNLYGDYMKLPPKEKRVSHEMIVTLK